MYRDNLALFVIFIVISDITALVFIVKDDRYFCHRDKLKLALMVIFMPIFGTIYVASQIKGRRVWYSLFGVFLLSVTCSSVDSEPMAIICEKIVRIVMLIFTI